MHAAVEAQFGVNLVGDDPRVLRCADIRHCLQFFAGEDLADRVVRVAQQQGAAAFQRLAQCVQRRGVSAIGLGVEFQLDLVQAPMRRRMTQRRVVRHLHDDILLRLDQRLERHVEAGFHTRQEDQLLRFDLP